MNDNGYFEEALQAQNTMKLEWEAKGCPTGCFYTWLVDRMELAFQLARLKRSLDKMKEAL